MFISQWHASWSEIVVTEMMPFYSDTVTRNSLWVFPQIDSIFIYFIGKECLYFTWRRKNCLFNLHTLWNYFASLLCYWLNNNETPSYTNCNFRYFFMLQYIPFLFLIVTFLWRIQGESVIWNKFSKSNILFFRKNGSVF